MSDERIITNGVNGLTGEYLLPPLDPSNPRSWSEDDLDHGRS